LRTKSHSLLAPLQAWACGGDIDDQTNTAKLHARILAVNFNRIQRADYVLAYINEIDCYGTMVEIGYARAFNKKLAIGIGPDITRVQFNELWMARGCATVGKVWFGQPQQVFNRFMQWIQI
jgi:Nucleoside 2-deoxyribosyltransferase